MEINIVRRTCGVTRWEGESNKSIYERSAIGTCANGVNCGVVKWLKKKLVV